MACSMVRKSKIELYGEDYILMNNSGLDNIDMKY